MLTLETWEIVLLGVAGLIAVTTLVRLMRSKRDDLLKQLRSDFDQEQTRLKREERNREPEEQEQAA